MQPGSELSPQEDSEDQATRSNQNQNSKESYQIIYISEWDKKVQEKKSAKKETLLYTIRATSKIKSKKQT